MESVLGGALSLWCKGDKARLDWPPPEMYGVLPTADVVAGVQGPVAGVVASKGAAGSLLAAQLCNLSQLCDLAQRIAYTLHHPTGLMSPPARQARLMSCPPAQDSVHKVGRRLFECR